MTPTPPNGVLAVDRRQDRWIAAAAFVALLALAIALATWFARRPPGPPPASPALHLPACPAAPPCPACAACPACPPPIAPRERHRR